ncbi:TPA: hypothetical protein DEB00_03980 [Candidatus Uhrbacteria bacterium]|nr:hypothetical protein [Candidatus Uhrbacteria bacterium]
MKYIKILLPLAAIVLILVLAFSLQSPTSEPFTGERAVSENGTAELIDFFDALNQKVYSRAASYVQAGCIEGACFAENKSTAEIAEELQTLCEDHYCMSIAIDEEGVATTSGLFPHTVAFLDAEGNQTPVCVDVDCQIKKGTTQFRMRNVDGLFYIVDVPPKRIQ